MNEGLSRICCFDVGGTGLKAAIVGTDLEIASEITRIPTTYPMPPDRLVSFLSGMAKKLGAFDRVSVGFPGMVRDGIVLSAPHFVTESGPGSNVLDELRLKWEGFDLASAMASELEKATRVDNDADQQGAAVISGQGLEMVITLGTGFGTAIFHNGDLAPHLEIAHHEFRKGQTYNEQLGEATRKEIGSERWNKRVAKAVAAMEALTFYDRLYIGGGNAKKIHVDLGPKVQKVDNVSGIIGGAKLWSMGGEQGKRSA